MDSFHILETFPFLRVSASLPDPNPLLGVLLEAVLLVGWLWPLLRPGMGRAAPAPPACPSAGQAGRQQLPELQGSPDTRVNNPDLVKKTGHGIFNDHKWLRPSLYISSEKQSRTF